MLKQMYNAVAAQCYKTVHWFWAADPIAQMRLEYARSVDRLKTARTGLEQYRALVEQSARRADAEEAALRLADENVKACLDAGNREAAAEAVLRLDAARESAETARADAARHEEGYAAHLEQIRAAAEQLSSVRARIRKNDAELRMAEAEGEAEALAQTFEMAPFTDFSELEAVVRERIDTARARVRVGRDLAANRVHPNPDGDAHDRTARKARGEARLREYEQSRLPVLTAPTV